MTIAVSKELFTPNELESTVTTDENPEIGLGIVVGLLLFGLAMATNETNYAPITRSLALLYFVVTNIAGQTKRLSR
ncbi:MAG: hypothetical protein WCL07_04710 [bacterium]